MANLTERLQFRADAETLRWIDKLVRWRKKRSRSAWLHDLIQGERVAYESEHAARKSRREQAA